MKDELRGQTNNLYQAYLKGDLSPEKLTKAEKQALEQYSLMSLEIFDNQPFMSLQDHAFFKK